MTEGSLVLFAASLASLMIVALMVLKGWQGWLVLKARELDRLPREIEGAAAGGMVRIELSDLKERIRKLEAIAAGVDL